MTSQKLVPRERTTIKRTLKAFLNARLVRRVLLAKMKELQTTTITFAHQAHIVMKAHGSQFYVLRVLLDLFPEQTIKVRLTIHKYQRTLLASTVCLDSTALKEVLKFPRCVPPATSVPLDLPVLSLARQETTVLQALVAPSSARVATTVPVGLINT